MNIKKLGLPESSGAQYYLLHINDEDEAEESILNIEDLQKARSFISKRDANRCMLIYASTKKILGSLLGILASKIVFSRNQFGKPYIDKFPLHFNLSHSGNYAILAVHPTLPIGVDIERKNRKIPLDSFLDENEKRDLKHPPTLLWSVKEAYLKALGIGFTQTLPVLTCVNSDKSNGISHFISHISRSHPFLLVHGYEKTVKNYNLATCTYTQMNSNP